MQLLRLVEYCVLPPRPPHLIHAAFERRGEATQALRGGEVTTCEEARVLRFVIAQASVA